MRCPASRVPLLLPLFLWACGPGGNPLHFAEATAAAGIDFTHTRGFSGQYFLIESNGGGAAFFDYDGDGYLDIYLVNGFELSGMPYKAPTDIAERAEDGFWVKAQKSPNPARDYDGAIALDSYIPYGPPSPPTNALYRNNGDGTFVEVTAAARVPGRGYGSGCAVADYDNDGDQDLYVSNYGPNILYRNEGDGTFAEVTEQAGVGHAGWGTSCAFSDYDRDGDVDLFVANYLDATLDNNKVCGGRVSTRQTTAHGPLHLITQRTRSYCSPEQYDGVRNVLYRNEGDGRFADVTRQAGLFNPEGKGLGVVFGDYNQDGYPDLFVANDKVENFLFQNRGDGTFAEVAAIVGVAYDENGQALSGMGTDFGDCDNDGDLDLIVGNFSGEATSLYRNEEGLVFTDRSMPSGVGEPSLPFVTFGINFFDGDNDGDLDIFAANGHVMDKAHLEGTGISYEEPNQLYRNDGRSGYVNVSAAAGECFSRREVSRGAAIGDYDNDGDLDILVTNCGGPARLYRNDSANDNHWLSIRTVGHQSNRDGIGARVRVVSGPLVQVREVKSGSGYLSASDIRVHFGLGPRSRIDTVEVRWPSGVAQLLKDVAADQFLVVEEKGALLP
jgi:hypothetical protein